MRVGDDLCLQLMEGIGISFIGCAICGENMVEVHERHPRELSDVASALSAFEEARHSKELAFVLESLATVCRYDLVNTANFSSVRMRLATPSRSPGKDSLQVMSWKILTFII